MPKFNMFSRNDASSEVLAEMEKNLIANARADIEASFNKVASAIDHLNRAAEIFDEAGLHVEAEFATRLIEVFAAKKKKKKKPSKSKKSSKKSTKSRSSGGPPKKHKESDPATKDLSSEKMVANLKEKGWVFNVDDMSADDVEFGKDEHESDMARIMHDLENEYSERRGEDEFEDDAEMVMPGDEYSRSMHLAPQRHFEAPPDEYADENADFAEEVEGPFPYNKPQDDLWPNR